MATKRTRFDPAAYMMQKLIDELMGGGDDISKQNSLTRYTNTINLHAGGFQSNYDISDLSSRISKIKSFHNGIKKDINYDPIIDEHVNIVIDKINNQLIKTGKFNVEIDNLKNINEQIPDVARRLKDAQDWNKSRGEILSIAEEAKNLVHSRSKASSSLEGLDFTRWSNSPELRFLSNSARVNSSYLVTSMHSDDLFDDREYRTLLQSIESNDPNIALQELKSRRDQAATSDEGLVENIIALGNDVNLQYDAYQTYLGQSNLTEDKNNNSYRIDMAVAGFSKDDIEIFEEEGKLTIKGEIKNDGDTKNSTVLHYGGLAQRGFTRNFNIAPNIKITEVTLENGVLSLNFLKDINRNRNQIKIS